MNTIPQLTQHYHQHTHSLTHLLFTLHSAFISRNQIFDIDKTITPAIPFHQPESLVNQVAHVHSLVLRIVNPIPNVYIFRIKEPESGQYLTIKEHKGGASLMLSFVKNDLVVHKNM